MFPNVAFLPGQLYILVFRNGSILTSGPSAPLPSGALHLCTGTACAQRSGDVDDFAAEFTTRAVPPTATVPEPGTRALVGAGLLAC